MAPALLAAVGLLGAIVGALLAPLVVPAPGGVLPAGRARTARRPIARIATAGAVVAAGGCLLPRAERSAAPAGILGVTGPALVPVALAYLLLAAVGVALAVIDLDTHRLPNALVLPGYAVLPVLLGAAVLLGAPADALLRAALGGAALFAFYAMLRGMRAGAMGGGDVKLAGVLGIALGFAGWDALIVGSVAAFLLGGAAGVALLVAGRAHARTALPFGPWMISGAWIGLLAGEQLAHIRAGPLAG